MLVGTYAQAAVLGRGRMSHRVRDYRQYLPSLFPLPHPSWRSQLWIQQNPWVDSELLPTLRNAVAGALSKEPRSEEHTSELQSLMRISYAVFCLKKKKHKDATFSRQVTNTKAIG